MKHTIVRKTFTALTVILLSQPLFATNISPDNRFMSGNEQSVTIDVLKFTDVWLKLHKESTSNVSQKHLQNYLENALDNTKGTLDVAKFSDVWNKAGNNQNTDKQKHLIQYLVKSLENASKSEECSHK